MIKKLMELGEMATLTQTLSDEAIEVLAEGFDKKVTFHSRLGRRGGGAGL